MYWSRLDTDRVSGVRDNLTPGDGGPPEMHGRMHHDSYERTVMYFKFEIPYIQIIPGKSIHSSQLLKSKKSNVTLISANCNLLLLLSEIFNIFNIIYCEL